MYSDQSPMLVSSDNVAQVVKQANCEIENILHHFDIRNDALGGGGGSLSRRRNAASTALQPKLEIYVSLWLNFTCRTLTLPNNPGTDGKCPVSLELGNFG